MGLITECEPVDKYEKVTTVKDMELGPIIYDRESLLFRFLTIQATLRANIRRVIREFNILNDKKRKVTPYMDEEASKNNSFIQVINSKLTALLLQRDEMERKLELIAPHLVSTNSGQANRRITEKLIE